MYYRASRHRNVINAQMRQWIKDGMISPDMGKGVQSFEINGNTSSGGDLIRGFNNYTRFRDDAESPIPDGLGGYVPNGGTELPLEGEKSRLNAISYDGVYTRDIQLMHKLYGNINEILYPIVVDTINNMEYSGSDVYDYALPRREGQQGGMIRDMEMTRDLLAQMVDEVYEKAVEQNDDFDEISCDENCMTAGFTREELLRAAIESLILTELYLTRRPFYRDTAEIYRFFDGRYDGVNPTY